MAGPGEYVADETEGISRVEDLPPPLIERRRRDYRRRRCPFCDGKARRCGQAQRICGVCPISHGMASSLNLEAAFKVTPPANGRILRNLVLGANYIQSHVLHFYHLAALDYINTTGILDMAPCTSAGMPGQFSPSARNGWFAANRAAACNWRWASISRTTVAAWQPASCEGGFAARLPDPPEAARQETPDSAG